MLETNIFDQTGAVRTERVILQNRFLQLSADETQSVFVLMATLYSEQPLFSKTKIDENEILYSFS